MTRTISTKPKIAVACQGGGSQTAFTAGVLKALAERESSREFEFVSISGTSGGAVCAALLWFGFLSGQRPHWQPMVEFWKSNTTQNWIEHAFNAAVIHSMRMVNSGMMPAFQLSPSSPLVKQMMSFATMGARDIFADFPALLRQYIDFSKIATWGPREQRPVLIIGAANVTTGALVKFVSRNQAIRVEHILASCCVPNIFPAVEIDGELYWDGLFSDNPPVEELIRARSVGAENIPDEIWVIKINPTTTQSKVADSAQILDRRNQLEGNISLFQQLGHLEMINNIIAADGFRPEYLAQFDIKAPIRIPKSFRTDPDQPYHIPWIEMPDDVQARLSYEGKIDRSPENINELIALGEAAAETFLSKRAAAIAENPVLGRSDAQGR